MSTRAFELQCHPVRMEDGRVLHYYDYGPAGEGGPYAEAHRAAAAAHPPVDLRILEHPSELRWNPTLGEWVIYAAHRMNRPQLPSREACPLCPGIQELPLPYQVAIFENRAPALCEVPGVSVPVNNPQNPDLGQKVPARGRCDIVVYAENHDLKFAEMAPEDACGLVEAWRHRYRELVAVPEVAFVSIFENKGREAGMTLDHPHGQIYSFPFLPAALEVQWRQTLAFHEAGRNLWQEVLERELRDGDRIVAQTDGFVAGMPFYARYPYEVHIWARRDGVSSLLDMTPQERRELAAIMQSVTRRYEELWPGSTYGFPTLMLMQQMTRVPGPQRYRFHVEFYPLQRSPDKMKYRASIETGAATIINDALPERQAAELRGGGTLTVDLADVIFD